MSGPWRAYQGRRYPRRGTRPSDLYVTWVGRGGCTTGIFGAVNTVRGVLLEQDARSWLLTFWEPLSTHAPSPSRAQPYCCYANTVIFYHRPYITGFPRPWRDGSGRLRAGTPGGFQEWDRVETTLGSDAVVMHGGERFDVHGGTVVWCRRRWWMRWNARRVRPAEVAA